MTQDPFEKNNVAVEHPDKVAELQTRIEEVAKTKRQAPFPGRPNEVVTKDMHGEPVMPGEDA